MVNMIVKNVFLTLNANIKSSYDYIIFLITNIKITYFLFVRNINKVFFTNHQIPLISIINE